MLEAIQPPQQQGATKEKETATSRSKACKNGREKLECMIAIEAYRTPREKGETRLSELKIFNMK